MLRFFNNMLYLIFVCASIKLCVRKIKIHYFKCQTKISEVESLNTF